MNYSQNKFSEYILKEEWNKAINVYEELINNDNQKKEFYFYLAIGYLLKGDLDIAETKLMSLLLASENIEEDTAILINSLKTIGKYLLTNQKLSLAQVIYEELINLDEDINNEQILAYIYRDLGKYESAELIFKKIIDSPLVNPNIYIDYGNILMAQYRYDDLIELLKKGINNFPNRQDLYLALVRILKSNGQAKEAIVYSEKGLKLNPNNFIFQLENVKILPILYDSKEEIEYYRERFTQGLDNIIKNLSLDTEIERKIALQAISLNTNFYLQYQGKNDLNLQQKYAELVRKIVKVNYPQIEENYQLNKNQDKIKIGLISSHFRDHNGANWSLGWVKNINRDKFTISCYYLENINDNLTEEFKQHSDEFYTYQGDLEETANKIIDDEIQILLYTDIGMKPQITKLASLKLAPIQCVTLGHPITSGFPTIDYYLSRVLMESENSEKYYTEKLYLLANIGICLPEIKLPDKHKTRQEFNLKDTDIIYLCTQSLFKYLPQFDYIYPEIAQKISFAKFIFIEFPISNFVNQKFRLRLKNIFASYNLNYQDYCVILPRLNEEKFNGLHLIGDIFLDTFTWSADNTCRLAVSCHLPIVTCSGEFMRGRHSYGILRMIEVEDTIAYSEEEYIKIAVKLGNNYQWREKIKEKIKKNKHKLFNDLECVKSLEKFFIKAVSVPNSIG